MQRINLLFMYMLPSKDKQHLASNQLLLFVFDLQDSLLPSNTGILTAVLGQTAITAYITSNHLLLFLFARQNTPTPYTFKKNSLKPHSFISVITIGLNLPLYIIKARLLNDPLKAPLDHCRFTVDDTDHKNMIS